ncbi:MAG: glycosyl hydrolase [Terriglobia bacterium]
MTLSPLDPIVLPEMKRLIVLALVTFALGGLDPGSARCQGDPEEWGELFPSPPARYGPSCNWWWFGGAYSVSDIRENLDAMKAAGLGGFRIFPVYPLAHDDPSRGIHNAPCLSPEFLQLVQEAVQYGSQIGMTADSLLGDGWPFGGPYIPPEFAAGQLKFFSQEVAGPQLFSGRLPGRAMNPEELLAVQAAEVSAEGGVRLESLVDLTARVEGWELRDWQVPGGRWLLMTFVSGYTGMKVKRASVGGEGLVLDHFSRDALELHLKHNGDVQTPYLRGAKSIFADSWEVFHSNWTPKLPGEFLKRRGYSLTPYLAALFLPSGEMGARVRYDFRLTLSELALENFFVPLNDWAHRNGFETRVQAHGTPADILEAYGMNDYPEGEAYGEEDRRRINIRDRKLASSAAHLFGRTQVSAESFTWLRCPPFLVTLENMKAAADASYLDGINQIYYHGVPLSPAWAEPPGWYYYAATYVGRGNPWWPYLKHLSDYIRRADFLLQQGKPAVRVAVYLPIEDVWSKAYGDWDDLAGDLERHMSEGGVTSTAAMLAALQDGGFDFDFVNARRVLAGRIDSEGLHVGPMDYRVVVLPPVEAIEPEAFERLRDFCRAGGTLIALCRTPERSPGFVGAIKNTARVGELSRELFGDPSDASRLPWRGELRARGSKCGAGEAVLLLPDQYQNLAPRSSPLPRVVAKIIPPDLLMEPQDPEIGFVHRETAEGKIYFIANLSAHEKRFLARFQVAGWTPLLFDALSGSIEPLYRLRQEGEFSEVDLTLGPWGSLFVVFHPGAPKNAVTETNLARILGVREEGKAVEAEVDQNGLFHARTSQGLLSAESRGLPAPLILAGPWRLAENNVEKKLDTLASWTQYPELRDFSGTASYRTQIVLPASYLLPNVRASLDLGEVHDIAEVFVNDKAAGIAWRRPYVLDISGAVKAGVNQLEIRVTNSLINRMRVKKSTETDRPPAMSPLMIRDYVPEPVASGLIGPVQVRASGIVTLR